MSDPTIVVLGATGFTGRLVSEELVRLGRRFVIAGRIPARLGDVAAGLSGRATTRVIDVRDRRSLSEGIQAGECVINCVGPFSELGEPVVQACINAGAHYLDTTGEQSFMRRITDRYHDAAMEAGVTVAPAMAFEYALGDCGAALGAAGLARPLRSVDVIYAWKAPASSRGTRRTVIRMLGRRGIILDHGRLRRRAQGSARRRVVLASGAPLNAVQFTSGEVLTVPRHLDVESVRGWAVVGSRLAWLIPLVSPLLPLVIPVLRPLIEILATRKPDPGPAELDKSRFTIRIELQGRTGTRQAVELRGRDPYRITAAIAATAAEAILRGDTPRGVIPPARILPPRPFLVGLAGHGLRLVENA